MIWEIIKYSFIALIAWILWSKVIKETATWLYLKNQGVVFMPGFAPITDLIKFGTELSKDLTLLPLHETMVKYLGSPLPDFTGMILYGTTMIFVNKAEVLEDFYVKKNIFYTKSHSEIEVFKVIMKNGPFVQRTEDPHYAPQRKILSSAFYKQKMVGMIEIIKSSSLDLVRKIRKEHKDGDIVDFIPISIELMSTIIVNVCVGNGRAYDIVEYKKSTGTEKIPLYESLIYLLKEWSNRMDRLVNVIFPALNTNVNMPWDTDFKSNVQTVRDKLWSFVEERLQNPKSNEQFDDILQYLLKDEYYGKNTSEITDILLSFFVAGAQTQQVGTANMVYYLEMNQQYKKRMFDQILPICDKMNDFQTELTTEVVEEFDYIRQCFSESMRIEPPAFMSAGSCFSQDVKIGQVNFKKDQIFVINIKGIHNDTRQWREPSVYNPDRFDPNSEWYKRPDGGIRSPFAFSPFLGGKRICLGKTLVDMTQRFTIPILFSAFDFKFHDPEVQSQKKPEYQIATEEVPEHKFKLVYRRDL